MAVMHRGQKLHVVARDDLDTRVTTLATNDDGTIPAFAGEDAARAWAAADLSDADRRRPGRPKMPSSGRRKPTR